MANAHKICGAFEKQERKLPFQLINTLLNRLSQFNMTHCHLIVVIL
jgi:hypothetical protein